MAIPELLEALLRARGPSGYETEAARIWREAAAAYGEVTTDVLGSSYVRVPGGDAPTFLKPLSARWFGPEIAVSGSLCGS